MRVYVNDFNASIRKKFSTAQDSSQINLHVSEISDQQILVLGRCHQPEYLLSLVRMLFNLSACLADACDIFSKKMPGEKIRVGVGVSLGHLELLELQAFGKQVTRVLVGECIEHASIMGKILKCLKGHEK